MGLYQGGFRERKNNACNKHVCVDGGKRVADVTSEGVLCLPQAWMKKKLEQG